MSQFMPLVTIITPTTGKHLLSKNIKSVQEQDYPNLEHYLVIDGPEFREIVEKITNQISKKQTNIHFLTLPFNTGHHGWNGHRVYASVPHLVDGHYIAYLDEDNYLATNHISSLMNLILKHNLDWAYSLRNIVDTQGKFICQDNCESLGVISPVWNDPSGQNHMCDTSTYMINRKLAMEISPIWTTTSCQCHPSVCIERQHKKGRDRILYQALTKRNVSSGCTQKHTLNYTIDPAKEGNSVQAEFFLKGNEFKKSITTKRK
jgi:hypothetical protein